LTTGEIYRFKVSAFNFNGEGSLSAELSTYSCTPPSSLSAPLRSSSTLTTMTLDWTAPSDDGGCPITGYALFRNDGALGATTTEVNSNNDPSIRDLPALRQAVVTFFPASPTGLTFSFKVSAFNAIASVDSETINYILGTTPSAPAAGPSLDSGNSNET